VCWHVAASAHSAAAHAHPLHVSSSPPSDPLSLLPMVLPACTHHPLQFPAACGHVAVHLGWSREKVEEEMHSRGVSQPYDILDEAQRAALMVSLSVCTAQRVLGCVGDARDARERGGGTYLDLCLPRPCKS
jgi:hypothetical protein